LKDQDLEAADRKTDVKLWLHLHILHVTHGQDLLDAMLRVSVRLYEQNSWKQHTSQMDETETFYVTCVCLCVHILPTDRMD